MRTVYFQPSGYESIRRFLVRSDYTPSVPDAVASFADLARGEPLRVTVFEQNLFFQDLLRGSLPLAPETVRALEEWMKLDSDLSAWGTEGLGEVSSDPPRYVSWFNGVTRRKGGLHVVTVATLTDEPKALALDRFRRYLSGSRP